MMRAKMKVESIHVCEGRETVQMNAVCGTAPFGAQGESEDNTFARYTPSGSVNLTITNPDLIGKFKPGQKFYLDFTEAN